MASSVFLDSHGWLALLNSADALHANADRVWRELGGRGYQVALTDWGVAETGNGLARGQLKNRFTEAVSSPRKQKRAAQIGQPFPHRESSSLQAGRGQNVKIASMPNTHSS